MVLQYNKGENMFNIYPVTSLNGDKILDISKRFIVKNIDSDYAKSIYFWYTINNWKSPENIAYDFYGSCDYVWVILCLNNIINPFEDWLFSDDELKKKIQKTYGAKMYDVHHYELNGVLYRTKPEISSNTNFKIVTNYEYEIEQNEKKRNIKILYPSLLSTIEHEVRALFV